LRLTAAEKELFVHVLRTRLVAAVAVLTLPLLLAACGSSDGTHAGGSGSSAPAAASHNDADVHFASQMIPHHAQAVTMAKMAASHGASDPVKALAAKIEAAQQPEIDLMSGWLRAWGEQVPMGDAHSSGHGQDGMMTADQMHELDGARGADWDRMFLTGMIAHHEGAVTMAKAELADGQAPEAKALAQQIIDAQQAEITQMRALLAG
jgi:uncharacterized protein (DUF305 family)